jgi:aspartyl-tRNA(Asn)/glutamyl-tRNA(Gln) amidotransferase subunit B
LPKKTANWILSELLKYLNEDQISIQECKITAVNLAGMIKMVEDGDISGKIAKEILPDMYKNGTDAKEIVEKKGLKQMSDTGELEKIIQSVLDRNAKIIEDYKGGKDKALGALVGQVMGATKGQANPKMVNEIILKLIA